MLSANDSDSRGLVAAHGKASLGVERQEFIEEVLAFGRPIPLVMRPSCVLPQLRGTFAQMVNQEILVGLCVVATCAVFYHRSRANPERACEARRFCFSLEP